MSKISKKTYQCSQCGHTEQHETNHYGPTYSWGRYHVCPKCPPLKKYPEYGGNTMWLCIDIDPEKVNTNNPYSIRENEEEKNG